jgi:hypothetical protein
MRRSLLLLAVAFVLALFLSARSHAAEDVLDVVRAGKIPHHLIIWGNQFVCPSLQDWMTSYPPQPFRTNISPNCVFSNGDDKAILIDAKSMNVKALHVKAYIDHKTVDGYISYYGVQGEGHVGLPYLE